MVKWRKIEGKEWRKVQHFHTKAGAKARVKYWKIHSHTTHFRTKKERKGYGVYSFS